MPSRPSYYVSQTTSRPQSYSQPFDSHGLEGHDEPFDVRADFDGRGPRWSEVYGRESVRKEDLRDDSSYRPVDRHVPPSGHTPRFKPETSREELVSVPVLGAEWQKSELHELTRRGKAEVKQESRVRAWRMWKRDQSGLCGVKWLTRKLLVIVLFILCVSIGITLFFVIPRAPGFSFYEPTPFAVDNSTIAFSRTPTNFSFNANLNLFADTTSSYLPVHFKHIEAKLFDVSTQKLIATGDFGNHVVPRGKAAPVILPITFSYSALNVSDTTWNDMYNACGHLWPGTVRPDLKLRLELRMSIIGLTTEPFSQTQISDVACPFELPANGV